MMRLLLWVALVVGAACGSRQAKLPGGAPDAEPLPDCAPLRAVLAEQDLGPASFTCEQQVDLDGDDRLDRAFISTTDGISVRLAIALGAERAVFIGSAAAPIHRTEYKESGHERSLDPDFSWLVGWKTAKRDGAQLVVASDVVGRFDVPDARGDGLWMTSGDVAVVLYRSEIGWVLMHLGY